MEPDIYLFTSIKSELITKIINFKHSNSLYHQKFYPEYKKYSWLDVVYVIT